MLNSNLKSFFAERSDYFGLTVNSPDDISVTTYAVNQNEHGTINFLVGDLDGCKYILKRNRDKSANEIFIHDMHKLSKVLDDPVYSSVKDRILSAEIIDVGLHQYACYKYFPFNNTHRTMRSPLFLNRKIKILDATLAFCEQLHESSAHNVGLADQYECILDSLKSSYPDVHPIADLANRYVDQVRDEQWAAITTIVHNDLVPGNILMGKTDLRVVDWEYWEHSLSIFNFFDVLTSFGSLLTHSLLQSRENRYAAANFFSLFISDTCSKRDRFLRHCCEYGVEMKFVNDYPPEVIEGFFFFYLMNKSTCQYKKYGTHYRSDLVWYNLLTAFRLEKDHFGAFWEEVRALTGPK